MATSNNGPSFNVYAVEDRGKGEDPFWLKIGACFKHKDGNGFNLILSAFPIDNRLVLRVPADPDAKKESEPKAKTNGRRSR